MKPVSKEKYLLHTKFETARMILAFMCREKLNEVAELFIKTCPYLEFERDAIEEGYAPFNFAYQPISDILHEYSQMARKLNQLVKQHCSQLSFPRCMTDLEKLEYLLDIQSGGPIPSQNSVHSGDDALEPMQSTNSGQTLAMSQQTYSQVADTEMYRENPTVSYMIIPDYDGSEMPASGALEYSEAASGATVGNYEQAVTNNAAVYNETTADIFNERRNDPAQTQYVLYDNNGNEQPIMIEVVPQGSNDIDIPEAVPQSNQVTSSMHYPGGHVAQYTTQNGPDPVGLLMPYNSGSSTVQHTNQYQVLGGENQQLTMGAPYHVRQEEVQTQPMVTGEEIELSASVDNGEQLGNNDNVALIPRKSTRLANSPPKNSTHKTVTVAFSSSASKKARTKSEVKSVPTNDGNSKLTREDNGCSAGVDSAVSALEEWQRIRSVNMSNFDNMARQEISKDMVQLEQEKSIKMRERRRAAVRMARQKKRLAQRELTESQSVKASSEQSASVKPSGDQKRTRPLTRKRKNEALRVPEPSVKQTKLDDRFEGVSNANDSLERHAAMLEAALYTPMKSDDVQQEQQEQSVRKGQAIGTVSQTPGKSIPFDTAVADEVANQVEAPTNENVTKQQEPQLQEGTDVIIPKPAHVLNATATDEMEVTRCSSVANDLTSKKEISIEFSQPAASEAPPAVVAQLKELNPSSRLNMSQSPDEISLAVASILPRGPKTPTRIKINTIYKEQSSDRKKSANKSGDDSSSSSSSSDSECNTSYSSASSTTTDEEDEGIRQMVANTKRHRNEQRPSRKTSSQQAILSVPKSAPQKLTIIRINGSKRIIKAQTPSVPEPQTGAVTTVAPTEVPPVTPTVAPTVTSTIPPTVVSMEASTVAPLDMTRTKAASAKSRPTQNKLKPNPNPSLQQPSQEKHQLKLRQDTNGSLKLACPANSPQAAAPETNRSIKEPQAPVVTETPIVVTPTRTKTPRKQQLIPTKLNSDDTFIPSTTTTTRVSQSPPQTKSPKPPARNRYVASRLRSPTKRKPTVVAMAEQVANTKVTRRSQKTTKEPAVTKAKGEPEKKAPANPTVVDEKQQENAPLNVLPDATVASEGLKSPSGVGADAIYAVLAQIHGK